MVIAELVLQYFEVFLWPLVAMYFLWKYREAILALVARSKIKFQFSGVTVETSLAEFEQTITESLRSEELSPEQWEWLRRLAHERVQYKSDYYEQLKPLRNSGLIWEYPEGWLTNAEEVGIAPLGKLLLEARRIASSKTE